MEIREALGKRLLFVDGAMGTMLQQAGLQAGEIPELWSLSHPEVVGGIHAAYLEAGCDIISTNTFGVNGFKLKDSGYGVEEVTRASVSLAREAVERCGRKAYVALDIGSLGRLIKPLGDLEFEEAVTLFGQVMDAGAGADLVLIETMSDAYELKAAVLAAKEHTNLPIFATVALNEQHKLLTGGDIPAVVALLEGLGVDALGVNCGLGPKQMLDILPEWTRLSSLPVIVQPNAGLPRVENGTTVFDVAPEEFACDMEAIARGGAWVLGGCCGTTPEHIARMVRRCAELSPVPMETKAITLVSSYDHAVELGTDPIMAGERINPNGDPVLKAAIRDGDMDAIMREALAQQAAGAKTLDVNAGLPEVDEPETLCRMIYSIQSVCDAPLQIDTSDPVALERAARLYNGKPMINSVNGKLESMHSVFPVVKKYGGAVIALTLDETGIPKTVEGRMAIARKIVKTAQEYGIHKKDLIIDTLAMAVSTGRHSAVIALETLRRVREELGVCTVLGVSNISFGLPRRNHVNAGFMTMAIAAGLSVAIINPHLEEMRNAFYASRALIGADDKCVDYIAQHSGQAPAPKRSETAGMNLYDAVVHGLKQQASRAVQEELKGRGPLELIDEVLVPALNEVGKGFEEQTLYLPQLLMSAEAAQAAFDVIRTQMAADGVEQQKKGKILIATVKGDIHDIGKNIVKALLLNYSFDVVDLGKDVPPERILQEVQDQNIRLVGLSALMTTTVVHMESTIELLHREAPGVKVMVGGAVLTERYANTIGADHYGRDAMSSVYYAQQVFGA